MINEIKRRSRKAGTIKRTREIWRDTVARSRYGYTVPARTSENYTSVAFLYGRESGALAASRGSAYCMSIFYRPIYLCRPLLNDENFIANCRGRKGFYGCLPGRVFISIPGTFRS